MHFASLQFPWNIVKMFESMTALHESAIRASISYCIQLLHSDFCMQLQTFWLLHAAGPSDSCMQLAGTSTLLTAATTFWLRHAVGQVGHSDLADIWNILTGNAPEYSSGISGISMQLGHLSICMPPRHPVSCMKCGRHALHILLEM